MTSSTVGECSSCRAAKATTTYEDRALCRLCYEANVPSWDRDKPELKWAPPGERLLDRKTFLVKERVGFFKLTDTFDLLDPATGARLGIARETVSPLFKVLRLLLNKRLLPTTVEVREGEAGVRVLSIHRGVNILRSQVSVRNHRDEEIGVFKSKLFSLSGGFHVLDAAERPVAEIKGDWKGWNFRLLATDGVELGVVTKKWAGLGKELFTSADNYIIALSDTADFPAETLALLLSAALAIDIVYKEK